MPATTTLRWIALALAGLVIAAGASVAASQLAGQRIGLASEPITAGNELAPPPAQPVARPSTTDEPRTAPRRTTPATPTVEAPRRERGDENGGGEPDSDD